MTAVHGRVLLIQSLPPIYPLWHTLLLYVKNAHMKHQLEPKDKQQIFFTFKNVFQTLLLIPNGGRDTDRHLIRQMYKTCVNVAISSSAFEVLCMKNGTARLSSTYCRVFMIVIGSYIPI